MSRKVVIIEPTPLVWRGEFSETTVAWPWVVGDAYFTHFHPTSNRLSPQYLEHVQPIRPPIVVIVPYMRRDGALFGTPFCIDNLSTPKNEPWQVTVDLDSLIVGRKPDITVHPSIHIIGFWHGWLQDGVLHQ